MPNPYNNEIIFNGQTLMSLKEDTVTPDKVLAGETFHDRSGAPQTGNLITHNVYDGLDSTSTSDALSANQGHVLNEKYDTLNSNLTALGKILVGNNNSSTVSVPNNIGTLVSSIVLTKGIWIVIGCADWQANEQGYRQIAFLGDGINPYRNTASTTSGIGGVKESYQQVIYIRPTNGETFSMYARQTSGSNLNIYPYLYAIKISNNG